MDKECFGDSENDYLQKVLERCSNGFGRKDVGKPMIIRSHVRFDLGNDRIPKFCLNNKLWNEAVGQFLVINERLHIFSQEDVSFEEDINVERCGQSKRFNVGDVKNANSKNKFGIFNSKVIAQLGRVCLW